MERGILGIFRLDPVYRHFRALLSLGQAAGQLIRDQSGILAVARGGGRDNLGTFSFEPKNITYVPY
jgi:hypothetical protein